MNILFNRQLMPTLVCLTATVGVYTGSVERSSAFVEETYNSAVFDENRGYRVLLPDSYNPNDSTAYPVVYYMHGFGGRYNQPVHAGLPIGDMDALVGAKDNFIMVLLDGSMNPNDPVPNIRPYNIGNDSPGDSGTPFDVQYKDYLPEMIDEVDRNYKTIPNRESRALFGHSMGGFMAFNLAGKYPQLVSAAVENMGSPEFYVGNPQRRVLYKKRDLVSNLNGVRYRLQEGTQDFLRFLNEEVNQSFERDPTLNYEFEVNKSGHSIVSTATGTENFEESLDFLANAFQNPLPKPTRWHHTDMYADFEKWDYRVTSNLVEEGFIALRGVTQGGFEVSTAKWTGGGPYVSSVSVNVRTGPSYTPNTQYNVLDYNIAQDTTSMSTVMSDSDGMITVTSNQEKRQFGIFRDGDPSELVVVGQVVDDSTQFLTQGQNGNLKLKILNRGGSLSSGITATISTLEPNIVIENPTISLDNLGSGDMFWSPEIKITANKTAPKIRTDYRLRFNIDFSDGRQEEVFVPEFFDVADFTDITIDDGQDVSPDGFGILGTGNADGIVNPGENIMVYADGRRLRLYTDDPNVEWLEEEQISNIVSNFSGPDFRLTSVIKISPSALPGTQIRFLANFETKADRFNPIQPRVNWGVVTLTVAAVPEPSTGILVGLVFPTLFGLRYPRSRHTQNVAA